MENSKDPKGKCSNIRIKQEPLSPKRDTDPNSGNPIVSNENPSTSINVQNIKVEKGECSNIRIKKEPPSPKRDTNPNSRNPMVSNGNPSTSINVQNIKLEKDDGYTYDPQLQNPSPPPSYFIENQSEIIPRKKIKIERDDGYTYDPQLQNPSPPPSFFIENQSEIIPPVNIKIERDDGYTYDPGLQNPSPPPSYFVENQSEIIPPENIKIERDDGYTYDPELQNPSPPPSYFIENQSEIIPPENIKMEWDAGPSHDVEKDEPRKKPREQSSSGSTVHSFYCEVCNLRYLLEKHFVSHVQSNSHRKVQKEVRFVSQNLDRPILTGVNVHNIGNDSIYRLQVFSRLVENCRPFIQSEIEEYKNSAVVGLNFVSEIRMLREEQDPVYYCYLCAAKCQVPTILNHIISSEHKMAYMKLLHLETYKNVKFLLDQKQCGGGNPIEGWSAHLEALDGRGQMMVEMQIDPEEEDLELIIESKMTHLPVASYRKLWNELDNIEGQERDDLIKQLIKAASSTETVEEEFAKKLEFILKTYEKSLHEKMCELLMDDHEKKKKLGELAKAQDYHGILETLFKKSYGGVMGINAKPIVSSLLKKPGIVYPVKKQK